MLQNEEVLALKESVARLAKRMHDFSQGKGKVEELVSLREEVVELLRGVPGVFLITSNGESAWQRLVSTGADKETSESLAEDLARILNGNGELEFMTFIDETFTVVYGGEPELIKNPLAYAILKVLYAWRGRAVKTKSLVQYLDDSDLIRGRSREQFPVVDDTPAGKKRITRAIASLPPRLRALITGNRNGRRFMHIQACPQYVPNSHS